MQRGSRDSSLANSGFTDVNEGLLVCSPLPAKVVSSLRWNLFSTMTRVRRFWCTLRPGPNKRRKWMRICKHWPSSIGQVNTLESHANLPDFLSNKENPILSEISPLCCIISKMHAIKYICVGWKRWDLTAEVAFKTCETGEAFIFPPYAPFT